MVDSKEWYKGITNNKIRHKQVDYVDKILNDFSFSKIICVETGVSQNLDDGAFGLYLMKKIGQGYYVGVDINNDYVVGARNLIREHFPNSRNISVLCTDSVEYLSKSEKLFNLAHLDSYDLDINNPFPSMLHHWNEFVAIKDKMPSGSIVIVDDNFMKGTTVYWNNYYNGKFLNTTEVPITHEIIGKGTLIYSWVKYMSDDWELIGDHYNSVDNIKVIIRKK